MPETNRITYVGHATLLIELEKVRILTDPLFRTRILHLHRQHKEVDPMLYKDVDAVLISHIHPDHLDLPSLNLFDRDANIIVPVGAKRLLQQRGFHQVIELSLEEEVKVGNLNVHATHAKHDGTRFKFGTSAETLGYIIEGEERIYFAGDTQLFPEMVGIGENLDVALLPVWGWGPNLGPGHLNPYQAAEALRLLRPRIAIPIHWGTFFPIGLKWLLPKFLNKPPLSFAGFANKIAPQVEVRILNPGENTVF